jgi:hypothetical protein
LKGIVWESAFSTEFKHANITINGTVVVREKDKTGDYVCVMGATALDASALGRFYRCRIRFPEKVGHYISLGLASQNILRASRFKKKEW